ncbi:short-chain dehydrogenase [Piscirickettsia salmonis]|uniref:NADP-dependent 3-hydroxy acid dehydrogenase YdfG n=1 Tax=Piscirickettsia salmonis TaxID=1238 RepID=A0A9Q6LM65_PISSA|nr:SDR family NAD(P)-dependent oxidoreductase [Piscirickettsia salmonis]ALA25433.1 short chain dehydrogenase family protein [Piscirickettsia salmonis]APS42952.1 short-chain dehydrogenase [Piscirickettsia salmonis]APS46300.1 short-chain dehydrogenase [Piscirickettsia salmonis]APS50250.1 short-chain dehydrogenase [Piscirickettsia salmonis]APS53449.1 short-chain dehydrogenase [Piscirickettsia salmonis]
MPQSKLTNKIILITGASSGIGQACAEQFAAQGAKLILTARRFDRLNDLATTLHHKYGTKTLPLELDVRDKQHVNHTIKSLPTEWQSIDILINNAGLGGTTELMQHADTDIWDTIIDTNVKGLLYVTKATLTSMVERNTGHIINIGSIAGHDYYKGGNVYSASKHAVKALTRSLRIDLAGHNIRISEIDPGAVHTEFSEKRWDKARSDQFYAGFEPLMGEDIADTVIYCATRPAHVNISEIMVYPLAQAATSILHKDDQSDTKSNSLYD